MRVTSLQKLWQEEGSEEKQQILAAAQTQLNQASRSLITSSKVTQREKGNINILHEATCRHKLLEVREPFYSEDKKLVHEKPLL